MGAVSVGAKERIAHVVRRLSMGPHPDVVDGVDSVDAATARALDLSAPAPALPPMSPPASPNAQRPIEIAGTIAWWVDQMRTSPRLIEERLVWFWHDHFATSIQKVRVPYLMHGQHATVRAHATGSFADLLHAMAKDPAMLIWLDGRTNVVGQINENFGRECLELFTLGISGGYSQQDVVEASRAFSGWVVNVQGYPRSRKDFPPWSAIFVPRRHDRGPKTLLGKTGSFDLDGALDVILEHPATAKFVTTKLYRELIGLDPDDRTTDRIASVFRRDYQIMGLVEAIVADSAFASDRAVRTRVRTPIEKLVGILQAAGNPPLDLGGRRRPGAGQALRRVGYIPFVPPNVGGFFKGPLLLGPHQLTHTFELLNALPVPPDTSSDIDAVFARFGLHDVSDRSRSVVKKEKSAPRRFALAAMSPEFAVT
jgi:uncharacterized protein (DUF1800 family)